MRIDKRIAWFFLALSSLLFADAALAQGAVGNKPTQKIALLIGNAGYPSRMKLENPVRDVFAIGDALRKRGFASVDIKSDMTESELERELDYFRSRVERLSSGSLVLIYYAGHGFSYRGVNYLVPVDESGDQAGVGGKSRIALSRVIQLISAKNDVSYLIMIDACRSTPQSFGQFDGFAEQSSDQALPSNATLVFSSRYGFTASDGRSGEGSPFARAMLVKLNANRQTVLEFASGVANTVTELVNTQEPSVIFGGKISQTLLTDDVKSTIGPCIYCQARDAARAGNMKAAASLLEKAALTGDTMAMGSLANLWAKGVGVPQQNCAMALNWQRKAGDGGDAYGYYNAAIYLRDGCGNVPRDIDEAIRYLELSRKMGDQKIFGLATYSLANIFGTQSSGRFDINKSIAYYRDNLQAYDCCSAINLAKIYYSGEFVPKNLGEARRLWQYAAERGNAKGWDGLGVEARDRSELDLAQSYFEKGSRAGYSGAMMNLASLLWSRDMDASQAEKIFGEYFRAVGLYYQSRESCAVEMRSHPGECSVDIFDKNIEIIRGGAKWQAMATICSTNTLINGVNPAECRYFKPNP